MTSVFALAPETPVPVVPVVVIEDAADAVPLARALVTGGLPLIEVTLRTPAALDAVRAIAAEVPDAVVGAGTVVSAAGVADAVGAGARFLVSPGWTERLLGAMRASGVPFLPGVSTTSEVVALLEQGVHDMKFFPAEAAGGVPYLKSLAGPLPQARFCPTGGVSLASAPSYLSLPNVGCVGGTWMLPPDALAARDWGRVEALAREAAALGEPFTVRSR
ncbi:MULTISPECIES: bifunctional 4-hydroxy-2-oxoglutarate aldolase/2-dehydro-3-deoxy-phosphogluconate aldolase [Streptomyces]|uniref:2-dehydro-3-deoxy-phosphogluconate aldolase n=1 Tax=Streptomyces venezuelae (strain ATCC 10712 / CBS 650.69 / DSM 40230 / JCM 4526 / NBRC 13096 / PD 04745) TaxID=953739 RepID=F2RKP0_STRVP|nr:bifunctional 4-hydroxy-2-oxoglutarate aldolase/2-dehydro-3-deoxy-phosphogluconate aldolase [Streptomyces venezuelae]APE21274.1 keto-deoxy-phosphogluconate aldolase [Streptomyces venezuelae]QER98666.1 bifunctional 4-hydroxy-2-oxoglutarate aldolase/2-dehydro-3-deoxy-phosphogluconate aldolase [Streptomyces venezuelae ATCC 10712]CCA55279.1 4-Hydroxy-2-oxoglutarate aldolase or 2-dehydro-3-deoxyphosphogluconate aldolase [Streptomyces venezuelae ATCC 10712]